MTEIQTIKITREEVEKLSEDFLLRMLRLWVIQENLIKACVTAGFLSDFLRKEVIELIFKGPCGLEEIQNQATEGRDIFQDVRPTSDEQKDEKKFAEIIEAQIKNQGSFQADIVYEIGSIEGKKLSVAEILSLILVCINKRYYDFAKEAATSLPLTKRAEAMAILC